jgi:hypothetical protein
VLFVVLIVITNLETDKNMIRVYNSDTDELIGQINEDQLSFLIDQLEEEAEDEEAYYIDQSTIEYLEEHGADQELLELLRKGLGEEEGIEIRIDEQAEAPAS